MCGDASQILTRTRPQRRYTSSHGFPLTRLPFCYLKCNKHSMQIFVCVSNYVFALHAFLNLCANIISDDVCHWNRRKAEPAYTGSDKNCLEIVHKTIQYNIFGMKLSSQRHIDGRQIFQ